MHYGVIRNGLFTLVKFTNLPELEVENPCVFPRSETLISGDDSVEQFIVER